MQGYSVIAHMRCSLERKAKKYVLQELTLLFTDI